MALAIKRTYGFTVITPTYKDLRYRVIPATYDTKICFDKLTHL